MNKIFETKVMKVGTQASLMIDDANMIILFGQDAPDDLAEYCYKIINRALSGAIKAGGEVVIDEKHFQITLVGELVEQNLRTLGHITISFDGEQEESLPGTLHVLGEAPNDMRQNSLIQIFS